MNKNFIRFHIKSFAVFLGIIILSLILMDGYREPKFFVLVIFSLIGLLIQFYFINKKVYDQN